MTNLLFTDDAIEAIHDFTGGIVRKVNNVCTAGLIEHYAKILSREKYLDKED